MKARLLIAALMMIWTGAAMAQTAATAPARGGRAGGRAPAPKRDPLGPGFVKATELPDGEVPPVEADGNFIIGPTHNPAPEMSAVQAGEPKGDIFKFTLHSTDS